MSGFVKFFGQGSNRSPRERPVLDAVRTSGSHRICTYPRGRRPRAVRDGDTMFMGHLVSGPNDIKVYGRAIARRYEEGRDDASAEDIALRPWLERWPHFIRVHDLEFVDSTLDDGVSLAELMDELGAYAFGPTAENADRGVGNVDPRQSIRQAAAIRLTEAGMSWLEEGAKAGVPASRARPSGEPEGLGPAEDVAGYLGIAWLLCSDQAITPDPPPRDRSHGRGGGQEPWGGASGRLRLL